MSLIIGPNAYSAFLPGLGLLSCTKVLHYFLPWWSYSTSLNIAQMVIFMPRKKPWAIIKPTNFIYFIQIIVKHSKWNEFLNDNYLKVSTLSTFDLCYFYGPAYIYLYWQEWLVHNKHIPKVRMIEKGERECPKKGDSATKGWKGRISPGLVCLASLWAGVSALDKKSGSYSRENIPRFCYLSLWGCCVMFKKIAA